MKITRTITIDGKTKAEYEQIVAHLETEAQRIDGWTLHKEPLVNRVTAVKSEEVENL